MDPFKRNNKKKELYRIESKSVYLGILESNSLVNFPFVIKGGRRDG
jgi:hypothetical protein